MFRKLLRIIGWLLAILVVLVAALTGLIYVKGHPTHGRAQYVAMGSSFASGPAITQPAPGSLVLCGRSNDNYAHQLARLRKLDLVDVTCGGAQTKHILEGGQFLQPAQLDAVTPETELVTLTIGGNDIAYMGNLMAMACNEQSSAWQRRVGGCNIRSVQEQEEGITRVHAQLVKIIEEVHRRAPKAQLVLLNYQTVLPETGTCERLGITAEQADQMRGINQKLAEATYAAAEGHGALYMDAAAATKGHDVCAKDPWMNGAHPEGGILAAPLHTTLAGMTAIAEGLNAQLGAPQKAVGP